MEVSHLADCLDRAIFALSREPAFKLMNVVKNKKTGGETWIIDTRLEDALACSAQRTFPFSWGLQNSHRYALAHRTAQCELCTMMLLNMCRGVDLCVDGEEVRDYGVVVSRYVDPSIDIRLQTEGGARTAELVSRESRQQHCYAYFTTAAGKRTYVDLTYCQGSLKAAAQVNGESPFMLVTNDATLNGLVVPDTISSTLGLTLTLPENESFSEELVLDAAIRNMTTKKCKPQSTCHSPSQSAI